MCRTTWPTRFLKSCSFISPHNRLTSLKSDNNYQTETDSSSSHIGLRNIAEPLTGLAELLRVTKPGGRLAVMEFSDPTWRPFSVVYNEYLMRALPPVARAVSSNPEAYVYLAESIRAWPDQDSLAALIEEVGWRKITYRNLTGGIVAIHHAHKPSTKG